MTCRWRRRMRPALRIGQLVCLAWLVATAAQILLAGPAAADNCSVFTDCFGQANSAAEATFGLALLAGLSLLLDFVPVVGDVKGIVEGVTGRDLLTGEELSPWERALGMIPLFPAADAVRGLGAVGGLADLGRVDGGLGAVGSAGRRGDGADVPAIGGRRADDADPPSPAAGGAQPPRGGGGDPPRRGAGDDPPADDGPSSRAPGPEDQARLDELARDPAHGGKITDGSRQEARVAFDLDRSGRLPGLERDPSGAADFIGPSGQLWDVKGFNSAYANGYDLETATAKIGRSIRNDESVILDMTKMSQAHIDELRQAVAGRPEWVDKIVWWP